MAYNETHQLSRYQLVPLPRNRLGLHSSDRGYPISDPHLDTIVQ